MQCPDADHVDDLYDAATSRDDDHHEAVFDDVDADDFNHVDDVNHAASGHQQRSADRVDHHDQSDDGSPESDHVNFHSTDDRSRERGSDRKHDDYHPEAGGGRGAWITVRTRVYQRTNPVWCGYRSWILPPDQRIPASMGATDRGRRAVRRRRNLQSQRSSNQEMGDGSMTASGNDSASLSADGVAGRSFAGAFRGYDRNEVRRFLSDLARQQKALIDRASDAESRLDDLRGRLESVEDLLKSADDKYQEAQARLDDMESEGPSVEPQPVPDSQQDAVKAFGEKVTEVLQIAVAAGNSIRAEAEAWASQRRLEADQEAADTVASARQEVATIVAREETNVERLRSTEEALRSWLRAAHTAIGQVLDQPVVGPGELAAVLGRIREIGPSTEPDEPGPAEGELFGPVMTDESQAFIPMPTVLTSNLG